MTNADVKAIAKIVAQIMAANSSGAKSAKPTATVNANGKTDRQVQLEKLTVTAFKRKGIKTDIVPRVNVKTFNLWIKDGFIVKDGEKSVKVKNLRLFHSSQVRPMTAEDEIRQAERSSFAKPNGSAGEATHTTA